MTGVDARALGYDGRIGDRLSLEVPRDVGGPALSRAAVSDRFAGRVSPGELEDLRVIVSELTTNALLHGTGEIRLRVSLDDGVVCGDVLDDGGGFAGMAPGAARSSGLHMVGALTERWGVQDGASRVWFVLAAQPVSGSPCVATARS